MTSDEAASPSSPQSLTAVDPSAPTFPEADDAPAPPEAFWDEVLKKEFAGESDRAAVIVGAALLDDALDTLLRARLAPIVSAEDSLFDGAYAPAASFSAR